MERMKTESLLESYYTRELEMLKRAAKIALLSNDKIMSGNEL